jgi:hypothetical protein
MRSWRLLLAATCFLAASVATGARAEPVRVAVVGFTGDVSAQELTELAQSVRASMSRQVNADVLAVVTREEMTLVYTQRGAPCRPDDMPCIVEASDAWSGRLFVRGVVRKTSEGIIVGATLESVRGILVAAAQTPVATSRDIGTAVPLLVRELLDGEKAYRERMLAQHGAPPATTSAPATVRCKAVALQDGAVPGELFVEDAGLRFESSAASERRLAWRYGWERVARADGGKTAGGPGLTLEATTKDRLVLTFATPAERDACVDAVNAMRKLKGR